MKQLFTFVLAAMAFVACTQNEVEELSANRADVPETLTVGFEGGDTRIELNEALKTVWTEGDEVSVFYRSNINQRWQYQGETGERIGDLRRVDAGSGTPTETTKVVIAYPYDEAYYLNSESCNLQAMLPAVQSYKVSSYGEGGNILVSQSEYNQFSLKSVCGWLRVELTGEGQMVESITLRGNAGEQVAGELYIDTATAEATLASEKGKAGEGAGGSLIFDDTISMEVTLDCGSGVELGAEAKEFYIALPPQTFAEGMTIVVNCAGYKPMTLSTESSITIERNHIVPMEAVEHEAGVILPSNELWYTATALVEPRDASAFNVAIVSNEWDETTGKYVITFDGELTTIGVDVFRNCDSLTSVTIPDNVTTIGERAFYSCDSLTSVTIGDSVTTIGEYAFYDCTSLTSVTIGDSVTTIGNYAFGSCSSLTSVTIPDNVTTIEDGAFASCHSLAEFKGKFAADGGRCLIKDNTLITYAKASGATYTIPDSVTTIGDSAFSSCRSLESVTIPDSVTTIEDEAFYYCSSLTSVTIGDSVTTIGDRAFAICGNLTSVTIPDSVTTIGDEAFYSCDSLTSVTIGNSVTTMGVSVFRSCGRLTSVTIPDSVTTIGYGVFDSCSSLTSVTIGNSVTTIGDSAFCYCSSLTSVTIPDSVTTIGNYAFSDCSSLTSVTIGDSVTTIGERAFERCSNLTSVTTPDSVTTIGDSAFRYCSSLAEFKGKFAADGGRCLIKDNTLIAYANASGTTYTIPDSVTMIGVCAFQYCYSLTSVTIPDSVTTIGDSAFSECYSLTSVTIPNSVTTIGDYAFNHCESLTSVTIGDSVTTIGDWAFGDCSSLTSVYCKATTPPSLGYNAFKYYDNGYVNIGCPIYVPTESVEAYKAASGWSEYAADIVGYDFETGEEVAISNKLFYTATALVEPYDALAFNVAIVSNEWNETTGEGVITFDGELTTIGDRAFNFCNSLTSVTIGDSVTTIEYIAFGGCSKLAEFKGKFAADGGRCLIKDNTLIAYANASGTTYTIPDSVTTIGNGAFSGCDSLTSVTIPDGVTTIGNEAFAGCSNLAEFKGQFAADGGRCLIKDNAIIAYANASGATYTLPDSVTTIGDYAFSSCRSLESVTIPDSVTSIGNYAFDHCSSLTSVTIPNSVTTIGNMAFYWCCSLTSVTIPDNVTTIGYRAFDWCDSLTSVTIPDSVTTIGNSAFGYCRNLTSVYITDVAAWCNISFGDLSSNPLSYAKALYLNNELVTELTIPDSVTTIGDRAFYDCDSLTSVTIPDSVTTIAYCAFYNCYSLTSVYCEATTPPTLDGSDVFDYNASGRKIYVPAESVEAYKAATNWSEYASYIVGYDFETGEVVE